MKSIKLPTAIAACALIVTPLLAHSNVQNEAVKARMHAMETISQASKTLGGMARGRTDYDAAAAKAAADALVEQAKMIPALFEAQETDPESEALPAIWENYADFTAKAAALEDAAMAVAATSDLDGLRGVMRSVGGSCQACHKAYRE